MATTWTLVGVGSVATTTGTTPSPTIPAGAQQGDLLVSVCAARGSQTFTQPTGWSLATSQGSGNSTDVRADSIASGALAWIAHGASAPATQWTLTTADVAIARILVYRPDQGSVGLVQATSETAAANTTAPQTGSITTDRPDCLIVASVCGADNGASSNFDAATDPATASGATDTSTAPTRGTWIERADSGTNSGTDASLAIADGVRETAGATGAISSTRNYSSRDAVVAAAFYATQLYSITAEKGSLSVAGQPAGLAKSGGSQDYPLTAGTGTFSIAGRQAGLSCAYSITASVGGFTVTGRSATLTVANGITADAGALAVSGNPAALASDAGSFVFAAGRGQFVATGQPAGESLALSITASVGSIAVTGRAAGVSEGAAYAITAQRGIIATVGYQSEVDWGRGMIAARGSFTLTGRSSYLEAPGQRRRFVIIT